ncbi:MAG: hypothetical protein ACR2NX_05515 [Chthoniobacterales bacterium]
MPRHVELSEEKQISTFHFPVGIYTLQAEDNGGYYYRAPQRLTKHAFPGSQTYDGGIYLRKAPPQRIRGYVVWAGGRTKIGNLTRARVEFRE